MVKTEKLTDGAKFALMSQSDKCNLVSRFFLGLPMFLKYNFFSFYLRYVQINMYSAWLTVYTLFTNDIRMLQKNNLESSVAGIIINPCKDIILWHKLPIK